jgi:hypothetical protein
MTFRQRGLWREPAYATSGYNVRSEGKLVKSKVNANMTLLVVM